MSATPVSRNKFFRLSYKANNNLEMEIVDLSNAFEPVAAELRSSNESSALKAHLVIAALPDGVAIVGSKTLGEDTHVFYNNATKATSINRTSCYHGVFDPLATYYYGQLYAMGWNATEANSMYFRSTAYTPAPTPPAPEPAPKGGTIGKTYKVDGSQYKVTSNEKGTVVFAKAKNAKAVTVPASVAINGKSYKVTAIAPKAFSSAKKKIAIVKVGKNVASIGKSAFAGCSKLKKLGVQSKKLTKKGVKGSLKGSSVKTV